LPLVPIPSVASGLMLFFYEHAARLATQNRPLGPLPKRRLAALPATLIP
jgi:hypothetical protein